MSFIFGMLTGAAGMALLVYLGSVVVKAWNDTFAGYSEREGPR